METNNAADPLHQQLIIMRNSLFDEHGEAKSVADQGEIAKSQNGAKILCLLLQKKMLNFQFRLLEYLEDGAQPNFAEQAMNTFFESSTEKIAILEQALEKPPSDFSELDKHLYHLKGSSGGVGAHKVWIEVGKLEKCIEERNLERAKIVLEKIKLERDTLELRMEPYFQLLRLVEPSRSQRPKNLT